MAEEKFRRKLTAILSADVSGYSRLMGEDEEATVRTLTSYREMMSTLIQKHQGRVVDSPGDNLLAEFASVLDAVRSAVEIQEELKARNAQLPDDRKMEFRIGINLGDVIEEGERIYGDGVNIAARVEGLAEPGGICISGTVYEHIKDKLALWEEYLGEHAVKNIKEPVRIYRVRMEPGPEAPKVHLWQRKIVLAGALAVLVVLIGVVVWNFYFQPPPIERASVERMAYPLPEKPSIAVLPFVNISGDPEQEYIGDGITESIITALSKIPEMFVIARTSTSTYKGKAVKVKQVSEELGVRYVLEGSVMKAGDRIRVTAQLIDAISGHHLWADRYDREIEDFFGLIDEIAKKVAIELQVKLTEGDIARISHKTENFEAWAYATTAYSLLKLVSKENFAKAKELGEKAVKLDPKYGFAWGILGAAHSADVVLGWSESRDKSVKLAVEYTDKALKLDETLSCSTAVKARIHLIQGQFEQAIAVGNRAIALGPSHDLSYAQLSIIMRYAGRFKESITLMKKAMRLNPHYPAWYIAGLAVSYFMEERYEEALEAGKRVLERAQKGEYPPLMAHLGLSAAYMELGRKEEARAHAAEVLRINPNFFLELIDKFTFYQEPAHLKRYRDSLSKAGLPDDPPLPLPDKPSIAVLPFVNMSGDPEQEYFSDGISEEIITALSKTTKLFVIARTSSFKYKGKEVDVRTVGRELGVRYVLEGSVRKSVAKVRITAQLIDAKTNQHLWADRYDRDLKDIFAVQDEITMKILTALRVKLTEGEQILMWSKQFKNLDIYLKAMEARSLWAEGTKEGHIRFGQVAQDIIDMAPELAAGYRTLAWHYWWLAAVGRSPKESLLQAFKLSQKAISMDESDSSTHCLLGTIYLFMRQYEKAITSGKKSIELDPNGAMAHGLLGMTLSHADRPDEAIGQLRQAIRLNPFPPYWYFLRLGQSYMQKGKYEEALKAYKKGLQRAPNAFATHAHLASLYVLLDRQEEAGAAAKKVLELHPNFSVERTAKASPFKNQAFHKLFFDAMQKAGLK